MIKWFPPSWFLHPAPPAPSYHPWFNDHVLAIRYQKRQRGGMTKTKSMTKTHWGYRNNNNKAGKGFLGWSYSTALPWIHSRKEHFGLKLCTYLITYLRTNLCEETTVNQNRSILDTLHSHKATLYHLTKFYYYPISSEQLVYGFEREKLVRSSQDAEKQSNGPMFETYLDFPKTHLWKRIFTPTPVQGYQTNQNSTLHRMVAVSGTEKR